MAWPVQIVNGARESIKSESELQTRQTKPSSRRQLACKGHVAIIKAEKNVSLAMKVMATGLGESS